jgi:Fe2+ transport system protein FeoA
MELPLTRIDPGKGAVITRLEGGHEIQHRLRAMGVKEGKTLRVVTRYPLSGPVVVEIDGRSTTIGRGLAQRILVEARE